MTSLSLLAGRTVCIFCCLFFPLSKLTFSKYSFSKTFCRTNSWIKLFAKVVSKTCIKTFCKKAHNRQKLQRKQPITLPGIDSSLVHILLKWHFLGSNLLVSFLYARLAPEKKRDKVLIRPRGYNSIQLSITFTRLLNDNIY